MHTRYTYIYNTHTNLKLIFFSFRTHARRKFEGRLSTGQVKHRRPKALVAPEGSDTEDEEPSPPKKAPPPKKKVTHN